MYTDPFLKNAHSAVRANSLIIVDYLDLRGALSAKAMPIVGIRTELYGETPWLHVTDIRKSSASDEQQDVKLLENGLGPKSFGTLA